MWEWLAAPMDASRAHDVGGHLAWHGRAMVLAWGILVPLGIFIARFFKIMPGQNWPARLDNRLWWKTHQVCQYSAAVLMGAGLYLILSAPPFVHLPGPHAAMGWTLVACAILQIAGGVLRGSKGGPTERAPDGSLHGDHYDMTPRRLLFEYVHKSVGYTALLLSAATILSGLWQANGYNWMWVTLGVWWCGLIGAAMVLQSRGMAVDTYQAIWGPDPALPGNKRPPIGVGVRRRGSGGGAAVKRQVHE